MSRILVFVACLGSFIVPNARGGETPAASAEPCRAEDAYGRLDFWLGEWEVYVGEDKVGTNRIETILGGCAVSEHWRSANGGEGRSLFYYLPGAKEWKQVWVTSNAMAPGGTKEKRLVSVLEDGGVRFQGKVVLAEGRAYLDRTTLTPLPGGRVRQLIEISLDEGRSWRTTFDATYVPRDR